MSLEAAPGSPIPVIEVGEVYRMSRTHPCGGTDFRVYRTGADIGIECLTCGRRVMLPRRRFESRARKRIEPAPSAD